MRPPPPALNFAPEVPPRLCPWPGPGDWSAGYAMALVAAGEEVKGRPEQGVGAEAWAAAVWAWGRGGGGAGNRGPGSGTSWRPPGESAGLKRKARRPLLYLLWLLRAPPPPLLTAKIRSAPRWGRSAGSPQQCRPKQCPAAQPLSTCCSQEKPALPRGPPPAAPVARRSSPPPDVLSLCAGWARPPRGWEDRVPSLPTWSLAPDVSSVTRFNPPPSPSPRPSPSAPSQQQRRPPRRTLD